jgi:membrane fusion protein (multidrug efflux system)
MRHPLIRVALVAALASAMAGLTACGDSAQSKELTKAEAPAKVPVEVGQVVAGALEPTYAATTTLEADREASLVAEIQGEVVEILVEEGDRVEAGQVLARVDSRWQSLELRQAQSVADRLAHESERSDRLLKRNMVSREAHDRARFDRETQQAAVDLARLNVTRSSIRAPYAGVITRRHIKQGQWLKVTDPAFQIADFDSLKARVNVPERVSGIIQAGQPVGFTADALGGESFEATVERVAPVVDRASGTVGVTVNVDNTAGRLRPGLFVRLGVRYQQIADATLLPKSAVISDGAAQRVFVVEAGTARERQVELGLENGEHVQVVAGVEPGATVVTVGQSSLKDGDLVQVINTDSAQVADASSATAAL